MRANAVLKTLAVFSVVFLLASCKSSEERAEEYYKSALSLIEAGDPDRAIVELRNVFEMNGRHLEARRTYGDLLRDTNRPEQAFSQYLRLVEQYPEDVAGQIALAEIAIEVQDWEVARRHGAQALALAPEDPAVKVIGLNLGYAGALEAEDEAARRAVLAEAQTLAGAEPDNLSLMRILIDGALRDNDLDQALTLIDRGIAISRDNRALWITRLEVLARLQRDSEIETQLREMMTLFPGDEEISATLLSYYVTKGQSEQAEALMRELAAAATDPEARNSIEIALIQFLSRSRGQEAALAEVDRILTDTASPAIFRAMRAGILFESGQQDAAVTEMQAIIEGAEPSPEIRDIKVGLAKMLVSTGNVVGARAQVEAVLAEDASQPEALKMKSVWLIEEDKADEAISLLRTVLDGNPRDANAMTLSAQAHARNGNRDLARDFLSQAVQASNAAPDESLRYAQALVADERFLPAEEVLINALRAAPQNPALLIELGQLYLRMEDWPRAEGVETSLRALATPETPDVGRAADGLRATRLAAQGKTDDSIAFLEGLAAEGGDLAAQIAVVRARLVAGDGAGAIAYAQEALAADPENLALQSTLASAQAATGDLVAATAGYRALLAKDPAQERVWTELIRVLEAQGDSAGAQAALTEALTALPEAMDLLWARAGYLERAGDIDGAIAIYDELYTRAPNSDVVANNLASLISTHKTDPESLERAYAIARRLRGSEIGPFQDTYGWIAYRRGAFDEALEHLEPAAKALPDDPLVQFHLGMTYVALKRPDEARAQLTRALELAGDSPLPQFQTAREALTALDAPAPAP